MTTPLDIITDAALSIGACAGGETPTPDQANDAFRMLNNLLDQLSNEGMMLFCKQEVIHELTPAQYIYTIGPGGQVGATFSGNIAGNVLTVTGMNSGALSVGQQISGSVTASGPITALDVLPGTLATSQPTLTFTGDGINAAATIYLGAVGIVFTSSAGTGYKAGDLVTVPGGTFIRPTTLRVSAIGGGGSVSSFVIEDRGQYTAIPTGTPAPTGGSGSGLTIIVPQFGLGEYTITNPGLQYTTCTGGIGGGGGLVNAGVAAVIGGTKALAGTTITSYGTATGGQSPQALGTYFLNLTQSGGSGSFTSFAPRPLKIESAFVRIPSSSGNLDYVVDPINIEQYEQIGLKQLSGPWPRMVYYQPSMPLGILNYWPNPSQGEMHLICDMLLNRFNTLSDSVTLPQGYAMALQWMLAEILIPQYPATAAAQETRSMIPRFAAQARAMIKRTNMQPVQQVRFDTILNSARTQDAGWILGGGFNRG